MNGRTDDELSSQAAEGDRLEQDRDHWDEPDDPERTASPALPDGVEADPADVVEQSVDVPDDVEDEREP